MIQDQEQNFTETQTGVPPYREITNQYFKRSTAFWQSELQHWAAELEVMEKLMQRLQLTQKKGKSRKGLAFLHLRRMLNEATEHYSAQLDQYNRKANMIPLLDDHTVLDQFNKFLKLEKELNSFKAKFRKKKMNFFEDLCSSLSISII